MPARFHRRGRSGARPPELADGDSGFGDWWAALAVLALAAVGVASLSGSAEVGSPTPTPPLDPGPRILAAINPSIRSLTAVEEAFASLCREPVLMALELEPDCETGVITLEDDHFNGFGSAELSPIAKEDVAAAITTYLARLRQMPALWDSLEAIELRGHSDPRAMRNPYTTNLVNSQQRPIGVLLFLMSPEGLADVDQEELKRLAVVSGVSFSRPPDDCPEATRECFEAWRRVEIRPMLSESLRRGDWSRTLQDVEDVTERIRAELQAQQPEE